MSTSKSKKSAYPGWPTHKTIMYLPHGESPVLVSECVPVRKLINHKQSCKYCYEENHDNWWLMDQKDYDIEGLTIILCGNCEHTSAADSELE